ncbi:RCS-specific HTH-type transcriptional activator RclR [Andreprevotia sp. IGB-42]|uniref:helix-turn-helix transcriptional regulator n=1 Tax=Andreprevotia sp. IGB-42 TaxID=2497473 RepID=UPI00135A6F51|nr:helix-turn-helix transcriptional regulator [Andreprevotia sp. IGB-42]KAF0814561.1 RCS-specific HTH-type transcriptional activator RclR [Andreprevotia sp. IGB-42]
MTTPFHEYFEVSPTTVQQSVGARVFYKPYLRALNDYDVMLTGITDAHDSFHVERTGAPFHVVLFALDGSGEITDGEAHQPLPAGHVAILPAGRRGGFQLTGSSWRLVWFLLNDSPRWSALQIEAPQVRPARSPASLYPAVATLCEEAWLSEFDQSLATPALTLVMQLLQRELNTEPQTSDVALRLQRLFGPVLLYPARPWRVDALAAEFGVSVAHFQRLCVRYLGASPQQMLLSHRMNRAMEMLQAGMGSVGEVATATGYEEIASFSRRFTQHFGMAPSIVLRRRGQLNPP